ncbi:hypothetical protein BEN48_12175 [Hymenobacter glacialis]|uniref:Uncharacterized protein n=2 Tax=Hymenobacter glacialis TaxID=1908236 RepID=A0A1G1T753_9BACT|nr:hypothetical protein BEN48_12175 [Hymenobacter glacialis]
MLFTAPTVRAAAASSPSTENPTATPLKTVATARVAKAAKNTKLTSKKVRKSSSLSRRSMLAIIGLEEGKTVTTPMQRERQLRSLQKQLRAKTRSEARTRRARCGHALR